MMIDKYKFPLRSIRSIYYYVSELHDSNAEKWG